MKMEKIIEKLCKYVEDKLYPTMVNWQRVAVRTVLVRVKKNPQILANVLCKISPILNIFEYMDENNNIDIESLMCDFKEAVQEEGELEFILPVVNIKYRLSPSDISDIHNYLKG